MEPGKILECKVCLEKHASPVDLKHHWGAHFKHYDGASSPRDVGDPNLPKEGSAPIKGLQVCAQCDFKTVFALGIKNHMKQVHSKNRKQLDVGNLSVKNITDKDKNYDAAVNDSGQITLHECSQCRHKTTTAKKLQRHIERSHDNKIHGCEHCKFKTKRIGKLSFHMRLHDTEQCTKCSYVTNTKVNLASHMQIAHDSVKDKLCPDCDFTSDDSNKLDKHIMKVHLKLKDKTCKLCDFASRQSGG